MKIYIFFSAILIFAVSGVGQIDRWRHILTADNGSKIHYDTETYAKTGTLINVWVKLINKVGYSETHYEFNCSSGKMRGLSTTDYAENGDAVKSIDRPSVWDFPPPKTVGAALNKFFCEDRPDKQTQKDVSGENNDTRNSAVGTKPKTQGEADAPIALSPGKPINTQAIELRQPKYPKEARKAQAQGSVEVQVLIDEKGDVIEATAISGDSTLRAVSVKAALASKFQPTIIEGKRYKVTGIIVYNFVL